MLIGRGGTGNGSADVIRGSHRGSSGVRSEENRHIQRDGRVRSQGWRARQAGRAIYRL